MYAAYVSGHFKAQVFSGLSSLLGEKPILSPIIPHFELVAERELRYHTPLKPLSPRSQAYHHSQPWRRCPLSSLEQMTSCVDGRGSYAHRRRRSAVHLRLTWLLRQEIS